MANELTDWFKNIPFFTRYWLALTVGISILAKFGILPAAYLYLDSVFLFKKFQVSFFIVLIFVHCVPFVGIYDF